MNRVFVKNNNLVFSARSCGTGSIMLDMMNKVFDYIEIEKEFVQLNNDDFNWWFHENDLIFIKSEEHEKSLLSGQIFKKKIIPVLLFDPENICMENNT